ncbi:Rrf2 family transcriptional regulator [Deltaproteobacteria bacterium TL4]
MLQLSKKVDYAIILLSHLGCSAVPVSAQEIATKYLLPQSMVANILKQLSATGMIVSKRGQSGGYSLNRPPEKVTLAEIIQVVDNEFTLVECAHQGQKCKVKHCPTQGPLIALHTKIREFMESTTLATLISPHHSTSLGG